MYIHERVIAALQWLSFHNVAGCTYVAKDVERTTVVYTRLLRHDHMISKGWWPKPTKPVSVHPEVTHSSVTSKPKAI